MKFREIVVCSVNDLKDGEMKAVSVGDEQKILLTKIDGNFFALGSKCTHYSAPLAKGVLCNGIIMCPWHHACFDAKTGDMLEPPAKDSLPKYETLVKGNDVIVKVPEELELSRTPEMTKYDSSDKRHFVILGGGAAGNAAAQALREAGFTGKVTMITKEDRVPYDRPNLSKAYLSGEAPPEWMPLRSEDFYKENSIGILFNKNVEEVNTNSKEILFNDNTKITYDKILLASGGVPKKLNVPGSDLKNIFYLRSFDDCDKIIEACKDAKKVVIIGSSFIGMESAYSLHERKLDVTVVGHSSLPFKNTLGNEIGNLIKELFLEQGINLMLNVKIKSFEGNDKVNSVVLENGESGSPSGAGHLTGSRIEADLVLIGIGVNTETNFVKGLPFQPDGSLKVNEFMEAAKDVFAAGDIAQFTFNGEQARIEHWRTAEQQGRAAGFNMADKKLKYNKIPFFWTALAGLNLRYVGYIKAWDQTLTLGDVGSKKFITFLIKNNQVKAAVSSKHDREMDAIEFLMFNNKMPSADKLKDINFLELLRNI